MLDALIIGGGPAGLAVANSFQKAGLDYVVIEKSSIAGHIAQYPTFMQFFSTRELLEIDGFPLTITDEKPSRRQYLAYLARFVHDRQLRVRTHTEAAAVERQPAGHFRVTLRQPGRAPEFVEARAVVVACGAFDCPRKLEVPGEDLPKVTHHFTEPHPYVGQKVLVVGGRNSAVETALLLWRAGAHVSLSYRRDSFEGYGLKYWLKPDIENRIANGEITGHLGTTVKRIGWESVTLADQAGLTFDIANDFVICHTGYNPPVAFLSAMGIEFEPGTNIPRHDAETLETNVPGLYIAGTITAGNVSGHVFIENSRHHGEMILRGLQRAPSPA
ncbi:MAG: thioredoxin reductase [Candidatus Sumerlaeota bacterium]|nr:thioredoxin reductase [Candidatus Sumerlaeota bacterium]